MSYIKTDTRTIRLPSKVLVEGFPEPLNSFFTPQVGTGSAITGVMAAEARMNKTESLI